jgi:hypothetical protein
VVATTETTIAAYEYYGHNRRSRKTVTYRGQEVVANDGGDAEVRFYYDNRWRILETRNGSGQTTFQHLWGTQYTDELVWIEKNGDPSIGDDTTPDVEATGESTEDPADARYFVHQDRNWNVVALTEYDTAGTNNGRVAERTQYTRHAKRAVRIGDFGDGELASHTLVAPSGTWLPRRDGALRRVPGPQDTSCRAGRPVPTDYRVAPVDVLTLEPSRGLQECSFDPNNCPKSLGPLCECTPMDQECNFHWLKVRLRRLLARHCCDNVHCVGYCVPKLNRIAEPRFIESIEFTDCPQGEMKCCVKWIRVVVVDCACARFYVSAVPL